MAADAEDVPSPIDFHDRAQALAWVERTERERPHRPRVSLQAVHELRHKRRAAGLYGQIAAGALSREARVTRGSDQTRSDAAASARSKVFTSRTPRRRAQAR